MQEDEAREHGRIFHLLELPHELQLEVFKAAHPKDLLHLCLALPLVGLEALRAAPLHKRLFVSNGCVVDEPLLRRYVRDARRTYAGVVWLNQFSLEQAGGQGLAVRVEPKVRRMSDWHDHAVKWTLVCCGALPQTAVRGLRRELSSPHSHAERTGGSS